MSSDVAASMGRDFSNTPVDDTGGFLRFRQIAQRSRAVAVAVDGSSN